MGRVLRCTQQDVRTHIVLTTISYLGASEGTTVGTVDGTVVGIPDGTVLGKVHGDDRKSKTQKSAYRKGVKDSFSLKRICDFLGHSSVMFTAVRSAQNSFLTTLRRSYLKEGAAYFGQSVRPRSICMGTHVRYSIRVLKLRTGKPAREFTGKRTGHTGEHRDKQGKSWIYTGKLEIHQIRDLYQIEQVQSS